MWLKAQNFPKRFVGRIFQGKSNAKHFINTLQMFISQYSGLGGGAPKGPLYALEANAKPQPERPNDPHTCLERTLALPITTSPDRARVRATLRRRGSFRKPIPWWSLERTHDRMMNSFSRRHTPIRNHHHRRQQQGKKAPFAFVDVI